MQVYSSCLYFHPKSVVAGNATADFDTSLPHKGVFNYLEPSIVEELKSSKLKTLNRASSDLFDFRII